MHTLAEYSIEEIIPMLGLGKEKQPLKLPNGEEYKINVGSPRLECLRRNQHCVWCNRKGNIFLLQRHKDTEQPHLNLFHKSKSGLLMMTQDHIVPRSKSGSDEVDNLQTMCAQCNQAKGDRLSLQFVLKMTGWHPRAQRIAYEKANWVQSEFHNENLLP